MTWDQLRQVVEDRHGITLKNPELERLMRRYISREGRPAERFELAVQTVKERRGSRPSTN